MERTALKHKAKRRLRRKRHIRRRVRGSSTRPRLSVFRSLTHIYAQIINDDEGCTLAAASTVEKDLKKSLKSTSDCDSAKAVGKKLAEKAGKAGISGVVFDRNGFKFHGRVKALAEGAREGGLEF